MILLPNKEGKVFIGQSQTTSVVAQKGPGTIAHNLFAELGLKQKAGCKCGERIKQMNAWGIEGCIANRETIIGWWKEAYHETTIAERIKAGWQAIGKPWLSVLDPLGSIFDELMRRANEKANNANEKANESTGS